LLDEKKKIVKAACVFGVIGLIEFPEAEGLDEDLEAPDVGRLLREVRDKVTPADRPYGEYTHRIGAVGHAKQLIVLSGKHEWKIIYDSFASK
jgi:hypothetical protein